MKHYLKKQANMYILYNSADVPICDIYLRHGRKDFRGEFEKIMHESFEVRE